MPQSHPRSQAAAKTQSAEPLTLADEPDKYLVGRVASSELARAVSQSDFPLFVWDSHGTVVLANQAAADLAGGSLDDLIGTPVTDHVCPVEAVERAISDLAAGTFDAYRAARSLKTGHGDPIPVCATVRAIEVDGQRTGVAVAVPHAQMSRLGRYPGRGAIDLVPIALGRADREWRIEVISSEVEELIGRRPEDCIGRSLLDMAHPEDAADMRAKMSEAARTPFAFPLIRFDTKDGSWRPVCVLVAPMTVGGEVEINFALVGRITEHFPQPLDRVKELELRLRRIGAEVRAAGLLESMDMVRALDEHPQLGELSSRQWEILDRLLRGERVPTIAKELFISQSTVRNHVSAIFERFGVHSQPELLALLRPKDGLSGP